MKVKKILVLVVAVAICMQGIPVHMAKAAKTESREITNLGKKGDRYGEDTSSYTPIYTIADLAGINNNPSGNYILMNDIDMTEETREGGTWDTGHGWTPLDRFSGVLDGNGYRIIGMHIYGNFVSSNVGLFSTVVGEIRNLGMVQTSVKITSEDYCDYSTLGSITGTLGNWGWGFGELNNCYVTGSVTGDSNSYVGGLVGMFTSGRISNCYNEAMVTGGGIVGGAVSYQADEIVCCYSVGGVTGYYPITASRAQEYIGRNNTVYADGYCGKYNYALQGKSLDSEKVKMLTEAQMRIQNMYVGFDFENTWEIDPNSSYPYPQLQSNRHQRVEGFDIVSLPTKSTYAQGEKIDLSGGTANIIYEGGYSTTVVLTDDMLEAYDTMQVGNQDIFIEYGGKRTSFPITVTDISVASIQITGEGNKLQKGNSMQLKASVQPANATDLMVEWSSSDSSIATVDKQGKVNALQAGSVVITATAANGISAQYSMEITVPCVMLKLNESELTLYKGETFTLLSTLSPLDTTDTVSWKISNSQIATIDDNGKVAGNAAGQVKVTATAGKATASCDVTVKRKMEEFHIEGVVDKEYTGEKVEQKVKVTDGSTVLKQDTDYEVSYTDNVEIGTANVHVTGKGFYEGSIKKSFNISKKAASNDKPDTPNTPNTPNTSDTPNVPDILDNDVKSNADKVTVGKTGISKLKNVKGKKIKVSFKTVTGADGYEIRYCVKSSMKGSKVRNTIKTSYTISNLKKKKRYYVQVRAYSYDNAGKKVYGKWGGKKSIMVKK